MKVLIVGGAGEIGRYLAKAFSRQGDGVKVLDRLEMPPEREQDRSVRYIQGDIRDSAVVHEAVRETDVIIHLAWSFADDPKTVFGDDIQGHIQLLDAASSSGVKKLIYASTATVYGSALIHPVTEAHPCRIDAARKPLYALGKVTAEELCRLYYREQGLPIAIFRFWWAFGETIGGRHLRDLIRKALSHQPLEMVRGAGGAFVTMDDLDSAVKSAIATPAASGQIYNVGSLFLTWEEIGAMIVQLTQSNSRIRLAPSSEWKGPAFLNEVWDLSWEKAKKELGYESRHSTERIRSLFVDALRNCIAQVLSG